MPLTWTFTFISQREPLLFRAEVEQLLQPWNYKAVVVGEIDGIEFDVGVYWIDDEDRRKADEWPYEPYTRETWLYDRLHSVVNESIVRRWPQVLQDLETRLAGAMAVLRNDETPINLTDD